MAVTSIAGGAGQKLENIVTNVSDQTKTETLDLSTNFDFDETMSFEDIVPEEMTTSEEVVSLTEEEEFINS